MKPPKIPAAVKARTGEYWKSMNCFEAFIHDCIVFGDGKKHKVALSDLRSVVAVWKTKTKDPLYKNFPFEKDQLLEYLAEERKDVTVEYKTSMKTLVMVNGETKKQDREGYYGMTLTVTAQGYIGASYTHLINEEDLEESRIFCVIYFLYPIYQLL